MLRNELLIYFPQKEFYGGDTVAGYAELRAPLPLQTFGVKLDLFGREHASVTGKSQVNDFLKFSQVLTGPGSKEKGRDWFGLKKRSAETISAGTHKYPFSFKLPDMLPPSLLSKSPNTGDVVGIEYELKITLEASGANTSDLVSSARIPVGGSLFDMNFLGNNSTPVQERASKTFMFTKGTLDVVVNLDSRTFLSGDMLKPRIDFFNKTSKSVNNVEVKLLQRIEVHNSGRLVKADEYVLSKVNVGTIPGNKDTHPQLELNIPTTAPESVFSRKIASGNVGKVVQISYIMTVHGSISMATDLDMMINLYVARRTKHTAMLHQPVTTPQTTPPQYQTTLPLNQPQQYYTQPQVPYNLPPPPTTQIQQPQPRALPPVPVTAYQQQKQPSFHNIPQYQPQIPVQRPPSTQTPPPQLQQQQPQQQQPQQQDVYQYDYVPDEYSKMSFSNVEVAQPQLQPTYEAFYPTLDDYGVHSYNPNSNYNQQAVDNSYEETIKRSLSTDSNNLDKHLDMMEQQFMNNNNNNNNAAYDQFFE